MQRKDGRFYPTPHIIGLMLGKNAPSDALGGAAAAAGDAASSGGYIVVETNYRLYAYTGVLLYSLDLENECLLALYNCVYLCTRM